MNLSEVLRAARELKKQYPQDAAGAASARADACFNRGDLDGFRNWNRVAHAIREMDRPPHPSEREQLSRSTVVAP